MINSETVNLLQQIRQLAVVAEQLHEKSIANTLLNIIKKRIQPMIIRAAQQANYDELSSLTKLAKQLESVTSWGEKTVYLREGNNLVKICGKQKIKSSKQILDDLVQAIICATTETEKEFSRSSVFSLMTQYHHYQIDIMFCWLKKNNLIVKKYGAQGYSLQKDINLSTEVERIWNEWPTAQS